jgi:hypothetical protein
MMQSIYDADECNPSAGFLKIAPTENNVLGPSVATESTVRTMSYESADDSVSTEYQNDEMESESIVTREASVEQQIDIIESDKGDKPCSEEMEGTAATSVSQVSFSQSEVEEPTIPTKGRIKKLRWGIIEMRLHSVIPGDHPDTREGPPVSWAICFITTGTYELRAV